MRGRTAPVRSSVNLRPLPTGAAKLRELAGAKKDAPFRDRASGFDCTLTRSVVVTRPFFERITSVFRRLARPPRLAAATAIMAAVLGAVLTSPSLFGGFATEDWIQRAIVQSGAVPVLSNMNLFGHGDWSEAQITDRNFHHELLGWFSVGSPIRASTRPSGDRSRPLHTTSTIARYRISRSSCTPRTCSGTERGFRRRRRPPQKDRPNAVDRGLVGRPLCRRRRAHGHLP